MARMIPLHHVFYITLILVTFVSGRCTKPRVRREWRRISPFERASWIEAVKCLANLPHNPKIAATIDPALSLIQPLNPNSSYFDDFSYVHMDLNVVVHGTGLFLPWHRLYVHAFENELRLKCGYDGAHPYWDWTLDSSDFYHSSFFSNSTFDGIGSWGDPQDDFQISTGGFKDMTVTYPVPHRIRRNYTNQPFLYGLFKLPPGEQIDSSLKMSSTFTREIVDFITNSFTGDYTGFQATIENFSGPHPGPHIIMGGEMGGICPFGLSPPVCIPGPKWSPNDPTFYLHHTMIDKIWYDWQLRDSRNKNMFAGGSTSWQVDSNLSVSQYPVGGPPWLHKGSIIPGDGLWKGVRVRDVMNTVGGKLCYIYA